MKSNRRNHQNNGGRKPPQVVSLREKSQREFRIRADLLRQLQIDNTTPLNRPGESSPADFSAVHKLADRINQHRLTQDPPGKPVAAGDLNALGLLDELMHYQITHYLQEVDSDLFHKLNDQLAQEYDYQELIGVLTSFTENFPPTPIIQGRQTPEEWLNQQSDGTSNLLLAMEELLLLHLDNDNPACSSLRELIDDRSLSSGTGYGSVIQSLEQYFDKLPLQETGSKSLLEQLRAPVKASPDSLAGQLRYIHEHWDFLSDHLKELLLRGLDLIREEEKLQRHGTGGPGPAVAWAPVVGDLDLERYSFDSDWMPRVVMQAKNTYVWLEQVSREQDIQITRLDQVPDAELDRLAARGITALWLIGVWERSPASQRIKQIMGDGEALASAYSLFSYRVAEQLGGEAALENLSSRAAARGIRLAGDMVPNHTGIDSDWMRHHPERFVQLAEPPYPRYSFSGENLSGDERVELRLEDGYSRQDDAAVVFRRVDRATGDVRYIYHGNDGTQMPWNDTAQLDLLQSEVREAIIQEILGVARRFPLIRFDAAMTLARRHFQRLWYPTPGTGGDIPSRAERGLSPEEFTRYFPEEFWREVVDRIQVEAPDTLLLAEAFWLMEGYFVRTLGMHRVYNSAFMHMLRDEENSQYRTALKQTLAWDARILERYVNFMSNPDEESAVSQFGRGDKYMGVCILLATLPGLPMLGHGQLEGLTEKYGMEFHRPRSAEQPDPQMLARHERLLFPLLRRRYLFAEVAHFQFYDLTRDDGSCDENVYAFSNRKGEKRALVVYHNCYAETSGRVHQGATVKPTGAESHQHDLLAALGLPDHGICRFRDHITGLEYLRSLEELHQHGLRFELPAYAYHVFLDFQPVEDSAAEPWMELMEQLEQQGVPSLTVALQQKRYRPLREELERLLTPAAITAILESSRQDSVQSEHLPGATVVRLLQLAQDCGLQELSAGAAVATPDWMPLLHRLATLPETPLPVGWVTWLCKTFTEDATTGDWLLLLAFTYLHRLSNHLETTGDWIAAWGVADILRSRLKPTAVNGEIEEQLVLLPALLSLADSTTPDDPATSGQSLTAVLCNALQQETVQRYLQVNQHEDLLWFNRELYHNLLNWLPLVVWRGERDADSTWLQNCDTVVRQLRILGARAEYKLEKLMELLEQ